ncbi:MAG: hypothetical protein Q9160_005745 [Pyrenula sp. 1 TL-2023]
MATWAYPPLPPDELKRQEDETQAKELRWLLESLQEALGSLKGGLEECVQLLKPDSTLVLSSLRSEVVKGWDITLRLPSHPLAHHVLNGPLALPQLRSLTTHLNSALDIIDVTRWTGDPTSANFISGQLRLLGDCITDARGALKGGEDVVLTEGGTTGSVDASHNVNGSGLGDAERSTWQLKKWFDEDGDCEPEVRFMRINQHWVGGCLKHSRHPVSIFDLATGYTCASTLFGIDSIIHMLLLFTLTG